jgi:PTS system glucitol/sorbitol-specific IIA component
MAERAGGQVRYETEVIAVGEQAGTFFAEGILVLFGEDAPEELLEFSVVHRPSVRGELGVGDVVSLGGEDLEILAVGHVANENLANLGHLVLKRNGLNEAPLPGDVCCSEGPIPDLAAGDTIRVTGGR